MMSKTAPCAHLRKVSSTSRNPEGIARCYAIKETECGPSCPFYRTEEEERDQEIYCIKRLQYIGYTGNYVTKMFGTISFRAGSITSSFDLSLLKPLRF